jgi:hypothetical protein
LIGAMELSMENSFYEVFGESIRGLLDALVLPEDVSAVSFNPEGESMALGMDVALSKILYGMEGGLYGFDVYLASKEPSVMESLLGYVERGGCGDIETGPTWGLNSGHAELVYTDDTINGAFYAAWQAGALEFEAPPSLFEGVDVQALGVENLVVQVSGMLPPVVSDCGIGNTPIVHVGDLVLNGSLLFFDIPMDFTVYTSFEMGLTTAVAGERVTVGLGDLISYGQELHILQPELMGYESLFEVLIEANFSEGLLTGGHLDLMVSLPLPTMNWKSWPVDLNGNAMSYLSDSVTRVNGGIRVEMVPPVP